MLYRIFREVATPRTFGFFEMLGQQSVLFPKFASSAVPALGFVCCLYWLGSHGELALITVSPTSALGCFVFRHLSALLF